MVSAADHGFASMLTFAPDGWSDVSRLEGVVVPAAARHGGPLLLDTSRFGAFFNGGWVVREAGSVLCGRPIFCGQASGSAVASVGRTRCVGRCTDVRGRTEYTSIVAYKRHTAFQAGTVAGGM